MNSEWMPASAPFTSHYSLITRTPCVVGKLLLQEGGGYTKHAHRTQRDNLRKRPKLSD